MAAKRLERAVSAYNGAWARVVLDRRRPLVIGITGSVGKTTTTEIVGTALQHDAARPHVGLVWKTNHNMNSRKGLPLTIRWASSGRRVPGIIVRSACASGGARIW